MAIEQNGLGDRLLMVREVAELMRVSNMTVYRLIKAGDLPGHTRREKLPHPPVGRRELPRRPLLRRLAHTHGRARARPRHRDHRGPRRRGRHRTPWWAGRTGRPPVVTRVGEVPLPPGAVRDGEVIDPAAVGAAITELWRQTGLRSRDVRVGLTGSRVVVRVIDMPAMPDDELDGAIRFSATDHIPIPLEEAVLDHAVLETRPAGRARRAAELRVLVAAAYRSTLDGLLAAVTAGGLRAVAVDLVPFALVRASGRPGRRAGRRRRTPEDGVDRRRPAGRRGGRLRRGGAHDRGRPRGRPAPLRPDGAPSAATC